jgi:Domain of unknown function (DUF1917)
MAVKKATSRTRSTTKRSKTTRSTSKRTTKAKSAAKAAPVVYTPTTERPAFAEPVAAATATDERPSRFTGGHYLHAAGPQPEGGSARRPGKWLIFVSRSRIDGLWETIRRAVEAGRLGHAAKVSTALPDPLSPDPKKHVILVYTGNEDDPTDVRRVRDALRQLGINWKIPYKSDAAEGSAAKYYE